MPVVNYNADIRVGITARPSWMRLKGSWVGSIKI